MQVTSSNFTVAEYCQQMIENMIVVNRDYQRSPRVWPPKAKSYLIETILLGYPMPKLSLYIKTDIKSRRTIKEIVDGQQRSGAILGFFRDEFAITTKGPFTGRRFSQLSEEDQIKFVEYQISVDLFAGATPSEIREVFRRMNSYTVPLNAQEKRHAKFQGDFKWFMVDLTSKYTQSLKEMGVFSESQLTRMQDSVLLSEITLALFEGILSASEARIDKFYDAKDVSFPESEEISGRFDIIFEHLLNWREIHPTVLMKPYNIYSLALAITHHIDPAESLCRYRQTEGPSAIESEIALVNLGKLAAAQEDQGEYPQFSDFVKACSQGTNRINQRVTRFQYYSRALQSALM